MSRRLSAALHAVVVLAGLLLLWQAVILVFHVPAFMLPTPKYVYISIVALAY